MATTMSTVPTAGTWQIDPVHSNVEFVVRHLLTTMRGRFHEFSGELKIAEDVTQSSMDVNIAAGSIDTHEPERRDPHLRSADFLNVEQHPNITFKSTGVRVAGEGRYAVDGELAIRGVSRPVTLDVEYLGSTSDPWGGLRAGFSAKTEINREDFGASWNVALEAGGVLVGKTVKIELEIEAVRQ